MIEVGISSHNSDVAVVVASVVVMFVMFVVSSKHTGSVTPIMEVR